MSRRVLVVDDEVHIREVAALALEVIGGYDVLTAASGEEAVEVAARERPDAILLDVMMPVLDGPATFELMRAREETEGIPVVLLTAKVQASEVAAFEELGVAGVVAKPFDPVELPGEIARMLGWDA